LQKKKIITNFKLKIMALINPHINFNGNAEEAFNFYKSVFGGEFATIMRFKDMASEEFPVNEKEADKLFNGLSAGGQIEMPMEDSPWGSYFGMFRDKYGIEWMVDFDAKYKGQI
jgi:PhnB protein